MKYIDIKITGWHRLHFKENTDMSAIARIVGAKGLDEVMNTDHGFVFCEVLYDTESLLTINQNDGNSTIEIFDDQEVLWENGK